MAEICKWFLKELRQGQLIVLEGKDKLLPTSHHNAMVHIFDLFWTWSPYSTGQVRKWGERGNSSRFGGCVQLNQQCQNFRQRGSLVAHRARAHRLVSNLYQSRYSFPSSTIKRLWSDIRKAFQSCFMLHIGQGVLPMQHGVTRFMDTPYYLLSISVTDRHCNGQCPKNT